MLIVNEPAEYREWLSDTCDVTFTSKPSKADADIVHLFVTSVADLEKQLPRA